MAECKTMVASPNAQDVAEVLAITLEREDTSGAPWCPPGDGETLRRWVTDRSAALGTGIRRVVRLARLMAVADGRDYTRFLYVRLPTLRARLFRAALQEAAVQGRLDRNVVVLLDDCVHLLEPAVAPEAEAGGVFEIDFTQMPRLAALLDFLNNALGFSVVADLLAPLLERPVPARSATDVARALHAALNAWLSERLESPNHMLRAQRMKSFLAGRGRVAPDAVDDEAILSFWIAVSEAKEEGIDGFRLYRSAAAAMLRYRQALRDAATARFLEDSLGRGDDAADAQYAGDPAEAGIEPWQSPVRTLTRPPTSRVKWLNGKEQHLLLNYLGGPGDDADLQSSKDDEEAIAWKSGLAGVDRFDLSFLMTLLRADVFGAVQASIVARLRKRAEPVDAITQAMTALADSTYDTQAAAYVSVRDQLRLECMAAVAALMGAGQAEAIILMQYLGGEQAVKLLTGSLADKGTLTQGVDSSSDTLRKRIAPLLKAAIADPSHVPDEQARRILSEALGALRRVSRVGFRYEDRADAEMLSALGSGAGSVIELVQELDRLVSVLSKKTPLGDMAGDKACFLTAFRKMYLSTTTA